MQHLKDLGYIVFPSTTRLSEFGWSFQPLPNKSGLVSPSIERTQSFVSEESAWDDAQAYQTRREKEADKPLSTEDVICKIVAALNQSDGPTIASVFNIIFTEQITFHGDSFLKRVLENKDHQEGDGASQRHTAYAFGIGALDHQDLENIAADLNIDVQKHQSANDLRAIILEGLDKLGEPCIMVEYDTSFIGGQPSGKVANAYLPVSLVEGYIARGASLDDAVFKAFTKQTHLHSTHLVYFQCGLYVTSTGENFVGGQFLLNDPDQSPQERVRG